MNIAVVCYHSIGGSGIIAYELGAEMARLGHKIHFLGIEPPFRMRDIQQNVMFHSVEVKDYPVFTYPPYTLSLASRLYEVIEEYEIDIIHCHYAVPHAVAGLCARDMCSRDVKVMTTLHGTDITLVGSHPSFFSITKHAIENSDCVTAVSNYLKQRTEEMFGVDQGKIVRVYNFINSQVLSNGLNSGCLDEKRCEKQIIIHASNLREVKRPLDLIRIFKKVRDRIKDCELWIIGDGPLKGDMQRLAAELGIADAVEFFGITSNPEMVFRCADIFLCTSREESFGLAPLEAMGCSTAVVAYKTGGIPEIVTGECGFLYEYGDEESMAQACIELLQDSARLSGMKEAAGKRAAEKFSKDNAVKEYISLCENIIE